MIWYIFEQDLDMLCKSKWETDIACVKIATHDMVSYHVKMIINSTSSHGDSISCDKNASHSHSMTKHPQ